MTRLLIRRVADSLVCNPVQHLLRPWGISRFACVQQDRMAAACLRVLLNKLMPTNLADEKSKAQATLLHCLEVGQPAWFDLTL